MLKGAGTAGEPPVAFAVTEGFHSRHFPKSTNLCGNLLPWGIPPVLPEAKPPPFGKGGFGLCFHYHRTNDTGHKKAPLLKGAGTAKP